MKTINSSFYKLLMRSLWVGSILSGSVAICAVLNARNLSELSEERAWKFDSSQGAAPISALSYAEHDRYNSILLDIRPRAAFFKAHIPGAINIPLDELRIRAERELPKSRRILIFCDFSEGCDRRLRQSGQPTPCVSASFVVASLKGYNGVNVLAASLPELERRGFSTVSLGGYESYHEGLNR